MGREVNTRPRLQTSPNGGQTGLLPVVVLRDLFCQHRRLRAGRGDDNPLMPPRAALSFPDLDNHFLLSLLNKTGLAPTLARLGGQCSLCVMITTSGQEKEQKRDFQGDNIQNCNKILETLSTSNVYNPHVSSSKTTQRSQKNK